MGNLNNEYPSSLVEQGIDVLADNWLDINDIDDESEIETYWDAENCQEDEIMDCESDSEEEVFWDSLSSIEEEIETLKEVNRDMSETIMDTKANGTECKFDDELFEEV